MVTRQIGLKTIFEFYNKMGFHEYMARAGHLGIDTLRSNYYGRNRLTPADVAGIMERGTHPMCASSNHSSRRGSTTEIVIVDGVEVHYNPKSGSYTILE